MNLNLNDKVVLITGSSRGIGRGIAEGFLKEGASVLLTSRNMLSLSKTIRELEEQHNKEKISSYLGDLNNLDVLESLYQFIIKKFGHMDHLVCNIGSGKSVPLLDEDLTEFKRMLEINLFNAVGIVNKLIPLLKDSAKICNNHPSITFIGSICGIEVLGCPIAYASAKSALVSYAKNISHPLGKKGIRVNVVSPGNIMFAGSTWDEKNKKNPDKVQKMIKREVPLQCFGTIEDVANVITFLASKRAKFVTGANWVIDGGQTKS